MDQMKALLSNRVAEATLMPGDHIYSWRSAYTYAHHGIYIGNGSVIHFTRGDNNEANIVLDIFSTAPTGTCGNCGNMPNASGVLKSCLNCFLAGGQLCKYEYSASILPFCLKRSGTCTLAQAEPPGIVLKRANYWLINGFGDYHIFRNNCEDFAIHCKTGLRVKDSAIGRSGQAVSFIATLSSSIPLMMSLNPLAVVTTVGLYYGSKCAADVGVRGDVVKVEIEDSKEPLIDIDDDIVLHAEEPLIRL